MKIISPLTKINEVEKLINAGTDELYCGIISNTWKKRYTNVACTNKREHLSDNFSSFKDIGIAVEIAHSYNVPVSLTFNSPYYSKKQYSLLLEHIERALSANVDSFIVADTALISYLNGRGIDISLSVSSVGTCFNSETAKFYRDMGVKRIILPRHLKLDEIKPIIKNNPSLEFECFVLNCKCINTEGFCTFQHGFNDIINPLRGKILSKSKSNVNFIKSIGSILSPSLLKYLRSPLILGNIVGCWLAYDIEGHYKDGGKIESTKLKGNLKKRFDSVFNKLTQPACGACALYDFDKAGMYGIKIVGREYSTEKKLSDLNFINSCLNLLKNKNLSKDSFISKTRELFMKKYNCECVTLRCYYPELKDREGI